MVWRTIGLRHLIFGKFCSYGFFSKHGSVMMTCEDWRWCCVWWREDWQWFCVWWREDWQWCCVMTCESGVVYNNVKIDSGVVCDDMKFDRAAPADHEVTCQWRRKRTWRSGLRACQAVSLTDLARRLHSAKVLVVVVAAAQHFIICNVCISVKLLLMYCLLFVVCLRQCWHVYPVSYTHLTLPTNREV